MTTNISDKLHIPGEGQIDILLDGESIQSHLPMTVKLNRRGVLVLAP